jgi:hypothetical protein
MALIWSDAYVQQLINDGETDIVTELTPIFQRKSLAIVSGTGTYTLPAYTIGLIAVTWKGKYLTPVRRIDHEYEDAKFRDTSGEPTCYSRYADGEDVIRFYPVPDETIGADDTNIYGTDIENRVIVSLFRSPDTSLSNFHIPAYIGRRVIKAYVLSRAFKIEGNGQNLRAAEYWRKKYRDLLEEYKSIKARYYGNKIPFQNRNMIRGPRRPYLPRDFTIS